MTIVVCMKWVALRPDIDPVTGVVSSDDRWSGPSPADNAALEVGLRLARSGDDDVHVVTVACPAADAMLRDAIACGASAATRVQCTNQASSHAVAAVLADTVRPLQPRLIICGDWSLDRGSGSVPPFLAAELGYGQACGLVSITEGPGAILLAERRLDGGRRERVRISGPAVLSVEGSVALLRRATMAGTLRSQKLAIAILTPKHALAATPTAQHSGPFRPPCESARRPGYLGVAPVPHRTTHRCAHEPQASAEAHPRTRSGCRCNPGPACRVGLRLLARSSNALARHGRSQEQLSKGDRHSVH